MTSVSDKQRNYRKRYYQSNRLKAVADSKAWYFANRDQVLKRMRDAYQDDDRYGTKKRAKKWYLENREKALARVKARYLLKRKEIRQHKRLHPEQARRYEAMRRANKVGAMRDISMVNAWMKRILHADSVRCYYCDRALIPTAICFDHIIPLSKGGPHSVENLCVACRPCNQRKHNKSIDAWVRTGQQVFSL